MESITSGLYKNPMNVLREYISNEIDNNPPPSEINVKVETKRLLISGNGPGMDYNGIRDAVKVGFSPKDPEKNIGFRGIGIYSGVAICNNIVITTKKKENPNYYKILIDCNGLREDIKKRPSVSLIESLKKNIKWYEFTAPKEQAELYGTAVELIDVLDDFKMVLNEELVRKYLEMTIPLEFESDFPFRKEIYGYLKQHLGKNFRVVKLKVNNIPIYRAPKYISLEPPIFGEISEKKKVLGIYWICQNSRTGKIDDEDSRGLVYRKRGFTVGDRTTITSLFLGEKNQHLIDYITGEVFITTDELIPNTERVEFEASPTLDLLEQVLIKDIRKEISEMARRKSAISKAEERIEKAQSLPNKPTFETYKIWLDAITKTNKLLTDLKNDLKNKYTPEGTKKKTERAIKRVENWIQKHSTPPKEEISDREIEKEISEEETTAKEIETKVPREDKIIVEGKDVAKESMETIPEKSIEEEKEVPEWIPSVVEDMCHRIGHNEWIDVTVKFVEVLKEEAILRNNDEIKNFLQKLELRLAI